MIKRIRKKDFFLFGGILFLFFSLRLPNLTVLPVFADEAIYIRWAQVMRAEPTLRFLPLSDGKQPLFMWMVMGCLKFFKNPLFVGRLVSVGAGFAGLVGIGILSWLLFQNKKISLLSAFFYAVCPFFVFYNRLALVDTLLGTLGIWVFIFGILLIRFLRLDLAMILGILTGLALITKSPALFFMVLLPTTLLLSGWFFDNKKRNRRLLKLAGFWLVAGFFSFTIYNLLRLGPNFEMIGLRNKDYVFSIQEILAHPHDPLIPHFNDLKIWLPNLFTWPILLLSLIGVLVGWKKFKKEVIFLLSFFLIPVLAQSVMARVFTPRYLFFAVWPLLILVALAIKELFSAKKKLSWFLLLACFSFFAFFYNWRLLVNPEKAPLPRKLRSGYLEEWTAGQGIFETSVFVRQRLMETDKNVLVGTEGYFGTLPDGLQIYLEGERRAIIIGVGQPVREMPVSLLEARSDNEVYLLVNESRMLIDSDPRLELVRKFPKAISPEGIQDFLVLYQLKNER